MCEHNSCVQECVLGVTHVLFTNSSRMCNSSIYTHAAYTLSSTSSMSYVRSKHDMNKNTRHYIIQENKKGVRNLLAFHVSGMGLKHVM